MQTKIPTSQALYHPNSVGGGCPFLAGKMTTPFNHYEEKLDGAKIRERSGSFSDHFSQARLFFNSLSRPEQAQLIEAFQFELGKVERKEIKGRAIAFLVGTGECKDGL